METKASFVDLLLHPVMLLIFALLVTFLLARYLIRSASAKSDDPPGAPLQQRSDIESGTVDDSSEPDVKFSIAPSDDDPPDIPYGSEVPPPAAAPSGLPSSPNSSKASWNLRDLLGRRGMDGIEQLDPKVLDQLREMRNLEVRHSPSTPSPTVEGGLDWERPPALDAREYRVWFGTNRAPVSGEGAEGFSGERAKIVRYGHCDVYVPKSHKMGSVGSSPFIRLLKWSDDRLKLRRTRPLAPQDFWSAVRAQLDAAPEAGRHAVIFIHGYNVSFSEAAVRAAQIGYDLGVEGAMAFFSWPSKGTVDGYPADGASIEASESAIIDFLVGFAERTGARAVHIIAHSMGNRGVLRAVSRIAQDAERRTGARFANFILAAPDVDADTFRQFASGYKEVAARTTLYVSARDRAVSLSRWLHDYPRVGFAPPISIFDGIDTINVTNADLTLLGHGYVAEAEPVLNDMHALIFNGLPPERRFRLREERNEEGERYWVVQA